LLEHYIALTSLGAIVSFQAPCTLQELITKVTNTEAERQQIDVIAVANVKKSAVFSKGYSDYYTSLYKEIESAINLIDTTAIQLTEHIQLCLEDLQLANINLPKLIRFVKRGIRKGEAKAGTIKIKHTKMNKRYTTGQDEVHDFRTITTREIAVLKSEIGDKTPVEVITDVANKLICISDSRETTCAEMRKLSQLLLEIALDLRT